MLHICTVCDIKYIYKGLALYSSVHRSLGAGKFTLHWLCIDSQIYDQLSTARFPDIRLYNLSELEAANEELQKARSNPKSKYGDEYSQFCWTLTPWFIDHLLTNERIDKLVYADSDIFFYKSPDLILQALGRQAVAIHTHRFTPPYNDQIDTGWYNVGVMAFNGTRAGINIARTWKSWLLDPGNPFYETHGSCGDQKYLELFIDFFGRDNVCVFDEERNIMHKAPWCTNGPDQDVVFYHFSHFTYDLVNDYWQDRIAMEWHPAGDPVIKETYYEQYWMSIKGMVERLEWNLRAHGQLKDVMKEKAEQMSDGHHLAFTKPVIDIIGNIRVDESKPERITMFLACLYSFNFLKGDCKIVLSLQDASDRLYNLTHQILHHSGHEYHLQRTVNLDYGANYLDLLSKCGAPYIMNFIEDHFCVTNNAEYIRSLLQLAYKNRADIIKASFHQVELQSTREVAPIDVTPAGMVYRNNQQNFDKYRAMWDRFYIGVNFITTRLFATRFWDRPMGHRPHEYEISSFQPEWEHAVVIPAKEVLAAIDNPHGLPGSNLFARSLEQEKFWSVYNMVTF